MQQTQKKKILTAVVCLVLLAAALMALRNQQYILTLLNFVCMYMISVSGLDVLFGYSGQISLGHAAFYAAGAYTTALMTTKLGLSVWLTIPAACVVSLILGIVVALPASKLIHHFLALLTISVGQLVYIVLSRAEFTNAMAGVSRIPDISIFGFELDNNFRFLIFMILMVALFLVIKQRIINSRVGRAFLAIRENPVAAGGIGINVQKYKVCRRHVRAFRGLYQPGDLQYLPVSHVHDHAALRRDGQFRRAPDRCGGDLRPQRKPAGAGQLPDAGVRCLHSGGTIVPAPGHLRHHRHYPGTATPKKGGGKPC